MLPGAAHGAGALEARSLPTARFACRPLLHQGPAFHTCDYCFPPSEPSIRLAAPLGEDASLAFLLLLGLRSSTSTALLPSPPPLIHSGSSRPRGRCVPLPAAGLSQPSSPKHFQALRLEGQGTRFLPLHILPTLLFPKRSSQTPEVLGCPQKP